MALNYSSTGTLPLPPKYKLPLLPILMSLFSRLCNMVWWDNLKLSSLTLPEITMSTGMEKISTLLFKVLWVNLEYLCESAISSSEYYVQMQQVYKVVEQIGNFYFTEERHILLVLFWTKLNRYRQDARIIARVHPNLQIWRWWIIKKLRYISRILQMWINIWSTLQRILYWAF
jgi:hypothetical protein